MAANMNRRSEAMKHGLIWFVLLFAFAPFYLMIVISFKDNKQFMRNPWLFDALRDWRWENWAKARGLWKEEQAASFSKAVGKLLTADIVTAAQLCSLDQTVLDRKLGATWRTDQWLFPIWEQAIALYGVGSGALEGAAPQVLWRGLLWSLPLGASSEPPPLPSVSDFAPSSRAMRPLPLFLSG